MRGLFGFRRCELTPTIAEHPEGWTGTATELLAALNGRATEGVRKSRIWPLTAQAATGSIAWQRCCAAKALPSSAGARVSAPSLSCHRKRADDASALLAPLERMDGIHVVLRRRSRARSQSGRQSCLIVLIWRRERETGF